MSAVAPVKLGAVGAKFELNSNYADRLKGLREMGPNYYMKSLGPIEKSSNTLQDIEISLKSGPNERNGELEEIIMESLSIEKERSLEGTAGGH